MTEFAENFSKDKRFQRTNWLCRCGNERESEDHITKECLIYDDIRKDIVEAVKNCKSLEEVFNSYHEAIVRQFCD